MQQVTSRKKAPARQQIRLNVPAARLTFLKEHTFFQDTSMSLRERLAPQLVKRSGELTGEEMLRQGMEPGGTMGYLFLTAPDISAKVEVLFDGKVIALLGGSAIFGMEVVFGVTKTFLFSIRVPASAMGAIWVIPSSIVHSLLNKDIYDSDAQILKGRAHEMSVELLHRHMLEPTTRIRLRLFENATHDFKHALAQAVEIEIYGAGTTIKDADEDDGCAIFVFRGEAKVSIGIAFTAMLSQASNVSAWAAWWGLLQVLGVTSRATGEIVAISDCIVWKLGSDELRKLRNNFPNECRLFDKVGEQHMLSLQPFAATLHDCLHLRSVDEDVLEMLTAASTSRICKAEEMIFDVHGDSDDLFFIARGVVSIRQSNSLAARRSRLKRNSTDGVASEPGAGGATGSRGSVALAQGVLGTLSEGNIFGELTCLGMKKTRVAAVFCDTLVDLRVISQKALAEAVSHDDVLLRSLLEVAKANGFTPTPIDDSWSRLPFLSTLTPDFITCLTSLAERVSATKGQVIVDQRQDSEAFFILANGTVTLEFEDTKLADLHAPQVLGAMSVLQLGSKNFYTTRCVTFCTFLEISSVRLHSLFHKFAEDEVAFRAAAKESFEQFQNLFVNPARREESDEEGGTPYVSEEGPAEKDMVIFKEIFNRFFKDSDPRFCDLLVQGLEKKIYFDGIAILKEGDEGDFAIIIQRGKALVEVGGVRVGEVKEGSLIGESVLVGSTARRTATVRALGVVSAFSLPRAVVMAAFQEFPDERKPIEALIKLREQANKVLTGSSDVHHVNSEKKAAGSGVQTADLQRRGSVRARRSSDDLPSGILPRHHAMMVRKNKNLLASTLGAVAGAEAGRRGKQNPRAIFQSNDGFSVEDDAKREAEQDALSTHLAPHRGPPTPSCSMPREDGEAAGALSSDCEGGLSQENQNNLLWKCDSEDEASDNEWVPSSAASRKGRPHLEWARRRIEAVRRASFCRQSRQVQVGQLVPLVPPGLGFVPPTSSSIKCPWAPGGAQGGPACKLRLQRARCLYDRPVWHESFGL